MINKYRMPDCPDDLPYSSDLSPLSRQFVIGEKNIANRFCYQPMEGCDGTADGRPGELTLRRYLRFAAGGPGIIWFEATAVSEDGRANPRQLHINKKTVGDFSLLIDKIKNKCIRVNGYEPQVICQLTHSGRYSKPHGIPAPLIAYNNPVFEKDKPIDASYILSDDALDKIGEKLTEASVLAEEAGFDGVDIKACHRYLLSELLSAYTRRGKYGGSFENRTRLLTETVRNAHARCRKGFLITTRLNAYDGFPYPYGFGVRQDGSTEPCFDEVIKLSDILRDLGVGLINITMGNPYVNPGVNRPSTLLKEYDPYKSVVRLISGAAAVAGAYPETAVVSSGLSFLGSVAPNVAAGCISEGKFSMAGFGRETLAYPDFARDVIKNGCADPKKLCITCGKCTELMRAGSTPGCVIRDPEIYLQLYHHHIIEKETKK